MLRITAAAILSLLLAGVACKDSSDVQTLAIEIDDEGCAPTSFEVDPGRQANIAVENDSETAFVIQDGDGRLEPIDVEPGESVEAFFDVPENDGTYTLLCEGEGSTSTEIIVIAGSGVAGGPPTSEAPIDGGTSTPTTAEADGTLGVSLVDFQISPSAETIPTGRYNIIATNVSDTSTHELNVLQLQPDGNFVPKAEIAPMPPQQGGVVLAALGPGTYRLACQIVPGEFGSTVGHYQQGMWFDILVLPEE